MKWIRLIKAEEIKYPKNREELISEYNGIFEYNGVTIEISNLYDKEKGDFSRGFGKSYAVSSGGEFKVFKDFDAAMKYFRTLIRS